MSVEGRMLEVNQVLEVHLLTSSQREETEACPGTSGKSNECLLSEKTACAYNLAFDIAPIVLPLSLFCPTLHNPSSLLVVSRISQHQISQLTLRRS